MPRPFPLGPAACSTHQEFVGRVGESVSLTSGAVVASVDARCGSVGAGVW